MPTYEFTCEVCGKLGRSWREEGCPPRFCDKKCKMVGMAGRSTKPVKYPVTPEIAGLIKNVYQTSTGNGEVKALARRIGYPRSRITKYAILQGWQPKTRKQPSWSPAEIRILEKYAYLGPDRIRLYLKKRGFERSISGIVLKRKRMRLLRNIDGHSARQVAECFGVNEHLITNAIKTGRLKAERRETGRTELQGGDIWFIRERDVKQYIIENIHELIFAKWTNIGSWMC